MVQVNDVNTQLMIDSGAVTPVEDFIRQDPGFERAQLLPPIARYYEVGGKLYSMPFATSCPVLYYNAEAFKAAGIAGPPATFAGVEQDAKFLTRAQAHVTGITWPLYPWFFEEFVARQGALLADHENGRDGRATQVNYTSPEALAFVRLWERMVRQGSFANVGRGFDPAEQNFVSGRSAMLITSSADIFPLQARPVQARDGTHPARRRHGERPGGRRDRRQLALDPQQVARRPSRRRPGALSGYMASREVQQKWHASTGYFPIRVDAVEALKKEGFYRKYPIAWTAIEQSSGRRPFRPRGVP